MISKLTDIHPEAQIGKNVSVGSFTTIQNNVTIGDNTSIGSNVTIMQGTTIGANCRVFPGAVLGAIPQDLKFEGEKTTVSIGDNTTIRECVTVNRGTSASGTTLVGSNCLLMAYVHIAHDCIVGDNCILANSVQVGGHVVIEEYAIIGGTSAIHQFSKIGAHTMIAGGVLVRKDVPPFVKGGRIPVVYVGVNSLGLKRRGFTKESINLIQDTYRILYQRGLNNNNALKAIADEIPATKERDHVINFIATSERGIIRSAIEKIVPEDEL